MVLPGPLVKPGLLLFPGMALPALYRMGVGRVPGAVLAFLWFVIQNLPWSLRSPTPSQGLVWLEWSQWAAGQVAGSGRQGSNS